MGDVMENCFVVRWECSRRVGSAANAAGMSELLFIDTKLVNDSREMVSLA